MGLEIKKIENKEALLWVGRAFLVIIAIIFWYISIPIVFTLYIWKKTKKDKKRRYAGIALVSILFILFAGLHSHLNRVPSISIIEPVDSITVQKNEMTVRGLIDPKNANLTINDIIINTKNGMFDYQAKLIKEENVFTLKVSNNNGQSEQRIVINRVFTEEELLQIEAKKAEEKAKKQSIFEAQKGAEKAKKAEELAEQKAWEQSKAGKICKTHPEWLKNDCEKLANNKIWIGMTLAMLKYKRGLPDSANPSNYGFGTEWQWCWHDYTPSCFYGDDDGIIDSYN